jgi:GxxExxY protein
MPDFNKYLHSELTGGILSSASYVFEQLGFGFLEAVYENALAIRLRQDGFMVQTQVPIEVIFEQQVVGEYRADILVNDTIILEIKAVDSLHPRHEVQLVNYLRATNKEVGLLINFGNRMDVKRKIFTNDRKK